MDVCVKLRNFNSIAHLGVLFNSIAQLGVHLNSYTNTNFVSCEAMDSFNRLRISTMLGMELLTITQREIIVKL